MTKKEQFVYTFKRLRDCLNKYYELDKAWYDSYMFNIELYQKKYPKVFQHKPLDTFIDFYCIFFLGIYRSYFFNRFKEWFNKSQYYRQFNLFIKNNSSELRSIMLFSSNLFSKKVTKVGENVYSFHFPYFLDIKEVKRVADQTPYSEYLPTIELKRITGATAFHNRFGQTEYSTSPTNAFKVGIYKLIAQATTTKVTQNILDQAAKEIPFNIKVFCELIESMHSDMIPLQNQITTTLHEVEITKNNFLNVYYNPEIISEMSPYIFPNTSNLLNSIFPIKQTCTDYYEIRGKINTLLSWLQDINRIHNFNQIRKDLNIGTFTNGRERNFNILTDSELETFQESLQEEYIPSTEGFIAYATEIYTSFGASPICTHVSNKIAAIKNQISLFNIREEDDETRTAENNFYDFKEGILRIVKAIGYYDTASKRLTRSYLKVFKADTNQFQRLVLVLLRNPSYYGRNEVFLNLLNLMYFNNAPSYIFKFNAAQIKVAITTILNASDNSDLSFAKLSLDLLKVLYIIELCYNYRTQPNHIDEIPF